MNKWTGHQMNEHYLKGGYANVQIRDNVNLLARDEQGRPFVDIESVAIDVMKYAGVGSDERIADVGSGFPPHFLSLLVRRQHTPSSLLAIEPNLPQASHQRTLPPYMEGIRVVEAAGQALPLTQKSMKVITALRSLYHFDDEALDSFHSGVEHALKPGGMIMVWTRGEHYKEIMREMEKGVCKPLSEMMGSPVTGPEPINAGFTSEKARSWLMTRFGYVRELRQTGQIVIDDRVSMGLVINALLTLTDMYEDTEGRHPSRGQYVRALREYLGSQLLAVEMGNGQIVDTFDQSLFVASNEKLKLPDDLKEIPAKTVLQQRQPGVWS